MHYISLQDNVDLGELMFSLCYLPTAGRLTITMIKARNLKAMDITGASGECFHWDVVESDVHTLLFKRLIKVVGFRAKTFWASLTEFATYLLTLSRSVCESVPDVWRPQAEEEEDVNQAQHSEPCVQWSHCVWRSPGEHRPDQPAHSCHGLWSVSELTASSAFFRFGRIMDKTFLLNWNVCLYCTAL